jgi:hypothetical protein
MRLIKCILFALFINSFNLISQETKVALDGIWSFRSEINKNHFILSKKDSLNFRNIGYQFLEEEKLIVRHFVNSNMCMLSDVRFINYKTSNWKLKDDNLMITWKKENQTISEKWKIINVSEEELEIKILSYIIRE